MLSFPFLFVTLSSHHLSYFPAPILYSTPLIYAACLDIHLPLSFSFSCACTTRNALLPILMHGLPLAGHPTHFQSTTIPSEIVKVAMWEGGDLAMGFLLPFVAHSRNMALQSPTHLLFLQSGFDHLLSRIRPMGSQYHIAPGGRRKDGMTSIDGTPHRNTDGYFFDKHLWQIYHPNFLSNCPSATLPTLLAQQYPHHSFDTSPHLTCTTHVR